MTPLEYIQITSACFVLLAISSGLVAMAVGTTIKITGITAVAYVLALIICAVTVLVELS